ncbi:hypothetical protein JTB14_026362 [Gonioctena quinquepunctata]|nr:hypothetical protein JTB14_026362 [Gonioctena quinquepunctata]
MKECETPYAVRFVLFSRKNGSIELTVIHKILNAITRGDKYPLPRMDDALQAVNQPEHITTLHLESGYYQVAVKPSDRDKTAFICLFGTFSISVCHLDCLTHLKPSKNSLIDFVSGFSSFLPFLDTFKNLK